MYCVRREGKKCLRKKTNTDLHRVGKEGDKKRQQKRDRIKIEKNERLSHKEQGSEGEGRGAPGLAVVV